MRGLHIFVLYPIIYIYIVIVFLFFFQNHTLSNEVSSRFIDLGPPGEFNFSQLQCQEWVQSMQKGRYPHVAAFFILVLVKKLPLIKISSFFFRCF